MGSSVLKCGSASKAWQQDRNSGCTVAPALLMMHRRRSRPLTRRYGASWLSLREDLLAFLRRRSNSREEAEELLQRFSLRALEHASDLRDVRTVRGWLGRVLASTIADYQRLSSRRRRREVAMEQTDAESLAVAPDSEVDEAICSCLYKLLPTLKPDYAEVIWRADILGEPRDRIAASLARISHTTDGLCDM